MRQELGKLENFRIKEREKEYNRRLAEIDQKATETKKDSVLRSLLKQKNDLETEYYDVIAARESAPKKSKAVRRGSGISNKKTAPMTKSASLATASTVSPM